MSLVLLTVLLRLSNVRRDQISIYRKIPKISHAHGAYIFQRPFLRGLFLEGLIFGGAYVRREICDSKSIGLACSGREIYHFCFVLLCIRGQIPSTSSPGGLYSKGRFSVFFVTISRGLYLEGLVHGGAYFRNFTVLYQVVHPLLSVVLVPETPRNSISSVSHTVSRLKHTHEAHQP